MRVMISAGVNQNAKRRPKLSREGTIGRSSPTLKATLVESIEASELVDAIADQVADLVVARIAQKLDRPSTTLPVDGDRMAELLGLSRTTIDRMARAKQIPFLPTAGGRRYIPCAVFDALAAVNEKGAADA